MATALILTLIAILRADSVDYETQNQFHYKFKNPDDTSFEEYSS